MIFVTVGTDMPFNRMVEAVDSWAKENTRDDVFAQIGETDWKPGHIPFKKFLKPVEFRERFASAKCIVAHAGMGTILTALHFSKPILVMPRQARLGEQRNEHQLATAKRLTDLGKINVALDEDDLIEKLDRLDDLVSRDTIGAFASEELVNTLRDFIHLRE